MIILRKMLGYFSKAELIIWSLSLIFITLSFLLFDRSGYLSLLASLIGATSLIFLAKGNPIGQVLIIIFSLIYGYISFSFAYYGEMLTYVGMSAPMAVLSLISWLRNPYKGNRAEVKIGRVNRYDIALMLALTVAVTVAFYFLLRLLGTANLTVSTVSVTTTFIAVFLTYKRSPYYALAYAFNDVVLICLWLMATISDSSYVSVVVCFIAFLANDIYSFINWRRMQKRQSLTD